jgi:hypothetical protein
MDESPKRQRRIAAVVEEFERDINALLITSRNQWATEPRQHPE